MRFGAWDVVLGTCLVLGIWNVVLAPQASADEAQYDRLQRAAFRYFLEQRDSRAGLVYNTSEPSAPASPTACGAALAALPIGVERGWIGRQAAYDMARRILKGIGKAEQERGFYYHFLTRRGGRRIWRSEVSCIDSAILFAGAMVIAQYFPRTEVERLANALIAKAEWPWFLNGEDRLYWSWKPESGFEGGPMDFSESILAYLIAIGSPTHPIPAQTWHALRRPVAKASADGPPILYTPDGSLFAYLLPLVWFDLRDQHDAYADYWTNARHAILENRRFCELQAGAFRTYREGLWGLSAAIGPDAYVAYGGPPAAHFKHDGTISPSVVATAIGWLPELSLATLRRLQEVAPSSWTRYGWGDAVNLDREFFCRETIALDQAMPLLAIENLRTGLIWRLFMSHPITQRAVRAAGFLPGRLEAPLPREQAPGNPGASLTVPMVDHAVTVDGDLAEWIRHEAIELIPRAHRNVESGYFRDAKDGSLLAYLAWDQEAFYLAGVVLDDELVAGQHGPDIYKDDCLEVFFDLDGDGFRFDGNPADFQFGLAPAAPPGAPQHWAWGPLQRNPQEVGAAMRVTPGGWYTFEMRIPLALLPGLAPGKPVRFSLAFHDRDADGKDGKLHWSVDSASAPGTIRFGELTLSP